MVLLASFIILASCGDDKVEVETVYGNWKLESGFLENVVFINVSEDKFTFYFLEDGFKQTESYGGIEITEESILSVMQELLSLYENEGYPLLRYT